MRIKKFLIGLFVGVCALGFFSCYDSKDDPKIPPQEHTHAFEEGVCGVCGTKAPSEGLSYTLLQDGTYMVSGMGACDDEYIVIGHTYKGKPITAIDESAFILNTKITKLMVLGGVKSIGDFAFCGCSNLTEVVMETGLKSIGNGAFSNCGSLKKVEIPDSVQRVGLDVFSGFNNLSYTIANGCMYLGSNNNPYIYLANTSFTSIATATINQNCKFIGDYAFADCDSLTKIVIPDGVKSLGNGAFRGCSNVTEIVIPDGVINIGDEAFAGCYEVTKIALPDSVASFGDYAFLCCYNLTEIVIPENVTSIPSGAFKWCGSLKNIIIPNSVTNVGDEAFYRCSNLTEITLPNSVTSIGNYAFQYCDILMEIVIPENVTSIGEDIFGGCDRIIIYCETESEPSGWVSGWNCFCPVVWDCNNNEVAHNGYIYTIIDEIRYALKDGVAIVATQSKKIVTAIIPKQVTYKGAIYNVTGIGHGAFERCTSLTKIVLPDGLTSIGSWAFGSCSLTKIVLPDSVTSIDYYAFAYCSSLTEIVIPQSVASIAHNAFVYCRSLTIYCEAESKPSGWDGDWNSSYRPVVWGYTGS